MSRLFPPAKDVAGKALENKGRRQRSVITAKGRIYWSRRRWSGGNVSSECPVDKLLDDAEASVSVGVRQLCCQLGTQARSFARGCDNLKQAAQLQVGEELFRQIVESEGRAIQKAGESERLELDWSGKDCLATTPEGQATTRLYASADGVLLPVTTQAEKDKRRATAKKWRKETPRKKRKGEGKLQRLPAVKAGSDQRYKQIYASIFYDQEQAHRLVSVTRHGVEGLGKMLKRNGERVGLLEAKERAGIVDGAVCLRHNLEVLPLQLILLDNYHFNEHVGDAAVATLGEGTPAKRTFLDKVLHTARHEGYAPFFQQILEWRSPLRGHKRNAADALIKYVAPREEMIRYEMCDQKGWDVGSGPMESMCGVTTDRLKGRGRRWDIDNAEGIMSIEALYQSTRLWNRYWADAFNHRN